MCRMDPDVLQDYIDGTIEPLEKIVLEEHLRVCSDCRIELNRLKIVDWDKQPGKRNRCCEKSSVCR